MGIFDIFKSKKRKHFEYLKLVLDISTEIYELIKKKKDYSDRGIIDLNYDESMKNKILVIGYYKDGVLDFFDEEYRNCIIGVFTRDECEVNYKEDLDKSYHFLGSFTSSLHDRIEELK